MSSGEFRGSSHWGFSHNMQRLGLVVGLSLLEQSTRHLDVVLGCVLYLPGSLALTEVLGVPNNR